jgi:hypothetical protein
MPDHADGLLNAARSWVLLFAHPGHELRAHHFMECVRPSVGFLTDGSGSTSESRLEDSHALLARVGARPAVTLGALTDRQAYRALMAADAEPFLDQVNWLADTLLTEGVEAVLVDAAEGYNPVHDICHWVARAATARVRHFGVDIALFELDLIADPDPPDDGLRLVLDDQSFMRKLDAIACYVALQAEAQAAFDRHGQDAFRVEFLRRVGDRVPPPASWIPYYEEVGETRVRAGRYTSVLRYGSHVRPVIERLLASVQLADYAADLRTPDQ